ncbi:DUF4376 domain-containing protein [Burkholderia stagnalis]|uniref:DUF4376 domain-containing protein n=1 Tax=Burkholderia stagnalis TaxID=1503054 RepID=UPI000F56628E|nr:hypothetical protein [Burkholderia stagnalis]RQQ37061.1 hypothetical protein DF163_01440 [Burkholderia stagnalis]RQQ55652.1 hypothetical protein DF162_01755 [Burkholderia stagnalis]RQY19113.1 hypothetical protein DF118_01760 [Burkholderia stagnalis]RQY64202.1 hypothetical protein DF112_00450 [Burkholderia stagnalis]RQY70389.1 hypothetical protein DF109_02270 [Burkholderia stagnalis]
MGKKFAAFDARGSITAFYDSVDSPVQIGANVIAITDDEWLMCINQRGQWYVLNGALAQVPPPSAAELLAAAKATEIADLNAACQSAILAGFASSALGAATFYPTTETDQRNLQSSALAASWSAGTSGWSVPLWCRQDDTWAYVAHTSQQVQQVNADWVTFRTSAQQKYAVAIDQVNAATTVDAVRAIAV